MRKIKKNSALHIAWGDLDSKRKKYPPCPHCDHSDSVIKRGKRKKKHEEVQLYKCKECNKTFTPGPTKGKQYPTAVILDGLSFYNLGYTYSETSRLLEDKHNLEVGPSTISKWVDEFGDICTYGRLRKFAKKLYPPQDILAGINLYHRQIYKFRIHKAKMELLIEEDIRHRKFERLIDYLETAFSKCPHYLFREGQRASSEKVDFDLSQVLVHRKNNFANKLSTLVLQAVNNNRLRHDAVQQFFLCNDTATVSTEVPIYLLPEDVEHMEKELDFKIPLEIDDVLTGHIDMIQVRNNQIHVMDYKPKASKEKPITQLTLYALALSRLTGIRVYNMKCAWFDQHDYFEFFPLHVVYKLREEQRSVPENQERLIKAKDL